jgi:hypothetical protein
MVGHLLASCGYEERPPADQRVDARPFPYAAIAMLASLRKNGGAREIDRIATDERQNPAVRLVCALAVQASGEPLETRVLLSVLGREKRLERRLVAIVALHDSPDAALAGAALVELMDGPNAEVRAAAIHALRASRPRAALPKLKALLDAGGPEQAISWVFFTLPDYKCPEAGDMLAEFLTQALTDAAKAKHLYRATSALETLTAEEMEGLPVPPKWSGRATSTAGERERARAAVDMWRARRLAAKVANETTERSVERPATR